MNPISTRTFNRLLASEEIAVIIFGGTHCAPCKALKPLLEHLCEVAELPLAYVDIDVEPGLARKYFVRTLPTVIMFKNGLFHTQFIGMQTQLSIINFLKDT